MQHRKKRAPPTWHSSFTVSQHISPQSCRLTPPTERRLSSSSSHGWLSLCFVPSKPQRLPHSSAGRTMTGAVHQANHHKSKKTDARLERHSGTGRLGAVKKGGAGGKHTWGVAGEEFLDGDISALDKCDPNYADDEVEFPGTVDKVEGSAEPSAKVVVEDDNAQPQVA